MGWGEGGMRGEICAENKLLLLGYFPSSFTSDLFLYWLKRKTTHLKRGIARPTETQLSAGQSRYSSHHSAVTVGFDSFHCPFDRTDLLLLVCCFSGPIAAVVSLLFVFARQGPKSGKGSLLPLNRRKWRGGRVRGWGWGD